MIPKQFNLIPRRPALDDIREDEGMVPFVILLVEAFEPILVIDVGRYQHNPIFRVGRTIRVCARKEI
jgi:hypothetical protein